MSIIKTYAYNNIFAQLISIAFTVGLLIIIMPPTIDSGNLLQYVRVYSGLGACQESIQMVLHSFKDCCSKQYHLEVITPQQIVSGGWQETTALLVIGGGYDVGYKQALGHDGISKIQAYVHSGGRYLGFCAGAYFGCGQVVFDKGGPLEVIGSHRLDFFPGECIGPVIPGFKYTDQSGACVVPVNWWFHTPLNEPSHPHDDHTVERLSSLVTQESHTATSSQPGSGHLSGTCMGTHYNGGCNDTYKGHSNKELLVDSTYSSVREPEKIMCYLNGGGYFEADQRVIRGKNGTSTFEVLATYEDQSGKPIAAVKCHVGHGMAVLSALHMEYIAEKMDSTDPHLKKILPTLEVNSRRRRLCLQKILRMLL